MLDAAPSCSDLDDRNIFAVQKARDLLLVRADELQAAANPLGDLLAWALRLWTGEPTDCGECQEGCIRVSAVLGRIRPAESDDTNPMRDRRVLREGKWLVCPACSGSGRHIGHPHTAEAVAWLDRLTDARVAADDEAENKHRLADAFAREAERAQRSIRF